MSECRSWLFGTFKGAGVNRLLLKYLIVPEIVLENTIYLK